MTAPLIQIQTANSALLYGKGVFTTISIFNRDPFLWEKHWRRLCGNAGHLGIDLADIKEERVRSSVCEAIAENQISRGRARITFLDLSPSRMWGEGGERRTELLINTGPKRPCPDYLKLTLSPSFI